MTRDSQDRWDAGERDYKSARDETPGVKTRAYTEAFRDGIGFAAAGVTREVIKAHAHAMPVRQGDAFLAGYYAELRRQRNHQDLERELAAARQTLMKMQGKNRALLESAVEKLARALAKQSIGPTLKPR